MKIHDDHGWPEKWSKLERLETALQEIKRQGEQIVGLLEVVRSIVESADLNRRAADSLEETDSPIYQLVASAHIEHARRTLKQISPICEPKEPSDE